MVKYFKIITTILLVLVITTGGAVVTSAMADEMPIFNNNNTSSVQNGPTARPHFTIDESYKITMIKTYHWNHGNGAQPGTIKLMDETGKVYGPWDTRGENGADMNPNCYWVCEPDITLPAGSYTVIDSDPDTWSCNDRSNNAGFVIVYGRVTGGTTTSGICGEWIQTSDNCRCTVENEGNNLLFTNVNFSVWSYGYTEGSTIVTTESSSGSNWGGATITDNGNTIKWNNGYVWVRKDEVTSIDIDMSVICGEWIQTSDKCRCTVENNGNNLLFTNVNFSVWSYGYTEGSTIVTTESSSGSNWGGATITDNGNTIKWNNGYVWVRP